MLKNKKTLYILIPVNILVWGFFVYRFYTAFTDSDVSIPIVQSKEIKVLGLKDSIAYKLSMDYKDPFLKESKREYVHNYSNSGNQPKKPAPVKTPSIAPAPKVLPDVKYLGLIKNNTSGMATALVSVNGQSKLIKQNESIDGIIFKTFNQDSLVAKWGRERIVVRK
ncbi:hypothetical protein [Aurantibacillus circumpalustris]|uniref:hypothetical protein n=1 Tax=Aurantibacillus circumpalustris TaxID=3036359 RepID=UPI00295B70E2|nr:hypothetical protein [Aurantibacillus circumpalustris]